ncbi:MAG: UMP kinase [Ruminococcaceae bacterium]|nr:UMP kinase [Oscillospiraceae bacterium]
MKNEKPVYKRVLLKLSGEAISAGKDGILNFNYIEEIASVIKKCINEGVQIGIIVGAGNIWRGRSGGDMDRIKADHMGMIATCINAVAVQETLIRCGVDAVVMTAVEMKAFAEPFVRDKAIQALDSGKVVIFGAGLGIPCVSTDTAAVVRAKEIGADIVLMAKNIDAIYTADPRKDPSAQKISEITYKEILARGLAAMDSTATSFAMENNLPIHVFGLDKSENIYNVIMGAKMGTVVKGE